MDDSLSWRVSFAFAFRTASNAWRSAPLMLCHSVSMTARFNLATLASAARRAVRCSSIRS